MMTDELIMMLDKFEAGTGKPPTKIICGEAAFEKLRREATDDWGADRYLEPNNRDGYIAEFMGIPIQVIRDNNVLENEPIKVAIRRPIPIWSQFDQQWLDREASIEFKNNAYVAKYGADN